MGEITESKDAGRLRSELRRRRRVAGVLVVLAVALSALVGVIGTDSPRVHADGTAAAMGMPFDGYWDRFGIAHPSYHTPSGNSYADWATDIYAAAGTAVRPRFQGPGLSLKVSSVTTTCGSAGQTVTLDVHTNGQWVGTARYGHLSGVTVAKDQWISQDTVIGYLSQWSYETGCWEVSGPSGVHTHITGYNLHGYSCYVDVGSRSFQNAGRTIGAVGGNLASGARQACSSDPTPTTTTLPPTTVPPTPAWDAAFVDQAAYLDAGATVAWDLNQTYPTQEGYLRFRIRNTGTRTWSNSGANPVRLGTADPQDHASSLYVAGSWISVNRAAVMRETSVAPGGVATFYFKVRIPSGTTTFREHFRPVADGAAWFGPTMWCDFVRPQWSASLVDQTATLDAAGTVGWDPTQATTGQTGYLQFRFRNTGSATWSSSGSNSVGLGTTQPKNRASVLYVAGSWPTGARAALVSPASVAPGQIGVFRFQVKTPSSPATLDEHFQLVAETITWFGPDVSRRLVVSAPPATTTTTTTTTTVPEVDQGGPVPQVDPLIGVVPGRLLESRSGLSTVDGQQNGVGLRSAGSVTEVLVAGRGGVPGDASAVVLNVAVTGSWSAGYVTVFPCGELRPTAANLNFAAGQTIANAVVAKVGAGGRVCVYTMSDTHLIVDVNAYV